MPENNEVSAAKWDDPDVFGESIKSLVGSEENAYLGDPDAVEALLRYTVAACLGHVASGGDPAVVAAAVKPIARAAARAFLGRDSNYRPVRGWNREGVIDEFAAKWIGVTAPTPFMRLEGCIIAMVNEFAELAAYAEEPGVLEEQWDWQVDALYEKYRFIFMGVSPPEQALL